MRLNPRVLSLLPMLMRFGAAGAKFAFVFVIASTGSTSLMGDYAILMVFVGLGSQFLGFELNAGIARVVHSRSKAQKLELIASQFLFHLSTYLVLLVPLVLTVAMALMCTYLEALLFLVVVYVEHFAVEIYRILVTLLKANQASYFQFWRTVPFISCLVVVAGISPEHVNLKVVASVWTLNTVIAILWVFFSNIAKNDARRIFASTRLRLAAKVVFQAKHLYFISCAGALTAYADKLIILNILGKDAVGVVYFFYSLASVMSLVVSFTVGVKEGPLAIKQFETGDILSFEKTHRRLRNKYIALAAMLAIFLVVVFYVSGLFGFNKYISRLDVFVVIVVSTAISIQADVVKLDYYLKRRDKSLLLVNITLLLLTMVLVYFLTSKFQMIGSAYAMATASVLMIVLLSIGKFLTRNSELSQNG